MSTTLRLYDADSVIHSITPVFEAYWRFARARFDLWERRANQRNDLSSCDPILERYRFTNSYRVLDRVSQYLIGEVQNSEVTEFAIEDIVFRTLLFKIFNKIDTWELIRDQLGSVVRHNRLVFQEVERILGKARSSSATIYSSAYIMPSPKFGKVFKHENHISMLKFIMEEKLDDLRRATSLKDLYLALLSVPGLGPFLAFQYATDLNYSYHFCFSESDFVVAGPGAHDGLSKCFTAYSKKSAEQVILATCEQQDMWFEHYGVEPVRLNGRKLQPIDCQNLFCEISKYSRVSHPHIEGIAKRKRIKQVYKRSVRPLPQLRLPACW